MSKDGHNGWTNYETWQASLWLDESGFSVRDGTPEDFIRDYLLPEDPEGLLGDIIGAWLSSVNWREIKVHYDEYNLDI